VTAAAAIAWEFRRRHRWGWIALSSYLLILAVIKLVIVARGARITFSSGENFAFVVVVPITVTFIYFLAVFTFGLTGDIAARQSMYPPRMFSLPLTTNALAGWPMLYGTLAIAVLWVALRLFALWPSDFKVPVLWPALMAASLLAWTQALTWMSYPLSGLRVIVTVLWLMTIDASVLVALEFKPSEGLMLAILAPHVPLAFLTARYAVGRARRGDVPHWRLASSRSTGERREHFASAARAQMWFEWRQHGRSLPSIVAILLPFELAMLFVFRETPAIIFETLALVLLTPPFMATFVAATVSKPNLSFTLTRPLTNASLISAKLKSAMWSTIAAWMLIVIALPIAVRLSGTTEPVREEARRLVQAFGPPRAIVFVLLLFVALVVSTWKQLVQSLYIGMTGREAWAKAAVFIALSLLAVLMPVGHWVLTNEAPRAALWNAIPAILIALVCLKAIAASWIALRRDDLLLSVIVWNACVFALYGVLAWIIPNLVLRHYVIALIAILAVPLVRISAIPLAVERNRHR